MENKELRMYGLVPYNLSPIQQGIQFGHALQEYNNDFFGVRDKFEEWSMNWKTFIILNGGTTNKGLLLGGRVQRLGTLNQHRNYLQENDVEIGTFYEPDLGNQLTAVVFLVGEKVFNKIKYPDWDNKMVESQIEYNKRFTKQEVFLREFLNPFKFA